MSRLAKLILFLNSVGVRRIFCALIATNQVHLPASLMSWYIPKSIVLRFYQQSIVILVVFCALATKNTKAIPIDYLYFKAA